MPPPGYEPFLNAICADPEDDTVRLVYADWLDENGAAERAEFIRLQIAFDRKRAEPARDRARFARYRAACRNAGRWRNELPRISGVSWPGCFRRGFAHTIAVSDGLQLVRNRAAVFGAAPIDTASVAGAGSATLEQVLELPEMNRVSHLWLRHCRLARGEWSVVARCRYLTRLNFLGVAPPFRPTRSRADWTLLTDSDARALAESPFLPRGLKLDLVGWVGPEAAALLRSRFAEVKTVVPTERSRSV